MLVEQQQILYLFNNSFVGNKAEIEGGAIKWIEIEPIGLNTNFYQDNTAIYGNDIASFPVKIEMENSFANYTCFNNSTNCYFSILNIASGSHLNFSLNFTIKDYYNQVYTLSG